MGNVASEYHSPLVSVTGMKPEAAKRNRSPDHVSLLADLGTRVPERVPGIIGALAFRPQRVGLYAFGVDVKNEGVTLVLESVEDDFGVVVGIERSGRLAAG